MDVNVLTSTMTLFITIFSQSWGHILPFVNKLMAVFVGIELTLLGLWWALGGVDNLARIAKKLLFISFWGWVVLNFPYLAKTFVDSLIEVAQIGAGQTPDHEILLDPSRIVGHGLEATRPLVETLSAIKWGIGDAIIIGITYILIILAYVFIGWQIFFAVTEFYMTVALVGIFLPFGFMEKTKFAAEKSIGAVFSHGVKLMVLSFLIAVIEPVLRSISFAGEEVTFGEALAMFAVVGALAYFSWKGPSIAAGLLQGTPSLSFGEALQSAALASMATGAAASTMAGLTRSAASAATSLSSGATQGIGNLTTGAMLGQQTARMGGASQVGAMMSGVKGASAALVQSTVGNRISALGAAAKRNWRMGQRAGYQGTGGTLSSGMQASEAVDQAARGKSSTSQAPQAPSWANHRMSALKKISDQSSSGPSSSNFKL